MTVCRIRRNEAEIRVKAIIAGQLDPELSAPEATGEPEEPENKVHLDIEQLARDQVLSHLEAHFKGHELARLVDAILRAQDYDTTLSPAGPDGGVDILAGRGSLGFDPPRICIQVKSSATSLGVNVLRELQGSMTTFKAQQGLLVSWGGFTRETRREARQHYFSVRLWDASDVFAAVVENYERLSEEIRSELPLKKIWALVLEE